MTKITISLVSHNQRHDFERLLPSLLPATQMIDSEILLVDNRSVDGTAEFVRKHFPAVLVMDNPQKAGYGENHNLNLTRATGQYFVIMNSDMIVQPNTFTALYGFMELHPDVGGVSPKVLNEDGTIQGLNKRYPTILDLFIRRFIPISIQKLVQQRIDYYEMRDVGYNTSYDVPFLSGAFIFSRTALLKSLGGFDTGYFLYFEDVDLCRRIQKTHKTVYYPDTSVTHFWSRSSHKKWFYTYHFIRSAVRYFARWGYKLW